MVTQSRNGPKPNDDHWHTSLNHLGPRVRPLSQVVPCNRHTQLRTALYASHGGASDARGAADRNTRGRRFHHPRRTATNAFALNCATQGPFRELYDQSRERQGHSATLSSTDSNPSISDTILWIPYCRMLEFARYRKWSHRRINTYITPTTHT